MTLILIPLKQELKFILQTFETAGWRPEKSQHQGFWFWHFSELSLILVVCGCGQDLFETKARFCLQYLKNIHHILCVGSAGALKPDLKTGELICSTKTIQYKMDTVPNRKTSILKPAQINDKDFLPITFCHSTSEQIIKTLKTMIKNHPLRFGPIISVDKDVFNKEHRDQIQRQTGGWAVAHEGVCGAKIAKDNGLSFIEIRAITDLASGKVHQDFHKNLQSAMKNLGELLLDYSKRSQNGFP